MVLVSPPPSVWYGLPLLGAAAFSSLLLGGAASCCFILYLFLVFFSLSSCRCFPLLLRSCSAVSPRSLRVVFLGLLLLLDGPAFLLLLLWVVLLSPLPLFVLVFLCFS